MSTARPRTAASWHLPPGKSAPAHSRELAAATLSEWGLDAIADDTVLLIDELVTNAVLHAPGPIQLTLHLDESALLCQVTDSNSCPPLPRVPGPHTESGRGLHLLHTLASTHGWSLTPTGKVVWFTHTT
ncbi:ATP-binding protein [Spirillospora sp. CA-294931]|uniref:ATP-binding protein n=1 Tax=Spirillospora sp. CA-294931 TaxID=3240042 RepID=UPI003D8FF0E7